MEGRALPQYSNSAVFNILQPTEGQTATHVDSQTSVTPPYFKSEPLDDSQSGQLPVHSVERILLQEYKPTISPALLSAVEQVTSLDSCRAQDACRPLITSNLDARDASRLQVDAGRQQVDANRMQTQPLPQLNTLVRSIGRSPPDSGQQAVMQNYMADQSMISPGRLSAAPSSGSGSVIGANDDLYNPRPISPLRGRGRPPLSSSPTDNYFDACLTGSVLSTVATAADGCVRHHTCPECGKRFPNNSALAKHRLIHSDERKFICDICQKAFKRQDHLNGHLNVHKTVKPFPCILSGCDKSYCDARSLRRHLEHSHNVQNPLVHSSRGTVYIKCEDYEATIPTQRGGGGDICLNDSGESAGQDSNEELSCDGSPTEQLIDMESGTTGHPNMISTEIGIGQLVTMKPVACPQCGRMFKNIPALNGHMRLHSRGKSPGNNNVNEQLSNDGAIFFSHESSASTTPIGHSSPLGMENNSHQMASYTTFQPIQQHQGDMIHSDMMYDSQPAMNHVQYHQQQQQIHQHNTLHQCYSDSSMHDYHRQAELTGAMPVHTYVDQHDRMNMMGGHINNHGHIQNSGHSMDNNRHLLTGGIHMNAAQHMNPGQHMNPNFMSTTSKSLNQALSVIVQQPPNSPYCSLPEDHDNSSLFPELDMPSGSGFAGHIINETPLDLGPDLSKDVDEEIIRRELELLYNASGPPFGGFGALQDDDDDFLLNGKLFERKRHLTAPSALLSSVCSSSSQNFNGGSSDGSMSMNNQMSKQSSTTSKSSRPPSRMRRKSRGKPDNVFMLLNQSWRRSPNNTKRQFQLPVSPVRFHRKHLSGNGNYPGAATHTGSGQGKHRFHLGPKGRNRPAPLIIPTPGTLNRFHSQLRSPRLWIEAAPTAHAPYTPPPMLSPVRKGSGLFWRINLSFSSLAGPKSAPISPKFCKEFFARGILTHDNGVDDGPGELLMVKTSMARSPPMDPIVSFDIQPPETDTTPHINVGYQYQADIPDLNDDRISALAALHKADIVFDPACTEDRDDDEIDAYVEFACTSAIIGGCQNKEYALHLLNNTGGNIEQSVLLLMNSRCMMAADHPTYGYEFVDSTPWSVEQIRRFQDALLRHDKDFYLVASEVKSKTVKQCVAFYYTWKKLCTEEYRRLKWMRRRRDLPESLQQPNAYNLRSCYDPPPESIDKIATDGQPAPMTTPDVANDLEMDRREINIQNEIDNILNIIAVKSEEKVQEPKTRVLAPVVVVPKQKTGTNREGVFPCRLCEKIFYKVKSRNAHMKSHSTKT